MGTRNRKLAAVLALGLGLVLAAVAQEVASDLKDQPAPPSESLTEADADVLDATADVARPASPEAATPTAWAVTELTPPDLGPLQITVYRDDTALVRERRQLKLHSGDNQVEIKGVSLQLQGASVRLRPLGRPTDFSLVEQLSITPAISSAALLQGAIGKPVTLRDGRYALEGTLLAVEPDGVIIGSGNEIHIHPQGEVVVPGDHSPGALEPRLSWAVTAPEAGEFAAELSYLTAGLNWSADYSLTTSDNDRLVGFEGCIAVENQSGASFEKLGLILAEADAADEAVGPRYYLPRQVDLPQGASKRFTLVSVPAVRSAVRYVATLQPSGLAGLRLVAELTNNAASGLGRALPPGPVRLYAPDRVGRLEYRGQQALAATALDDQLSFDLGPADDLDLRLVTNDLPAAEDGKPGVRRVVTLRNLRTEDVVVRLVEQRDAPWTMTASSIGFTAPAAGSAHGEVTVPANGVAEVRYQLSLPAAAAPAAAE